MLPAVQPYFIFLFVFIIIFLGGVIIGTRFGGILYCKLNEKPFLQFFGNKGPVENH